MKANIGSTDKVVRLILGAIIIILGFYFNTWWGIIGLVPIITVAINFCPIYGILGISTRPKAKTEK